MYVLYADDLIQLREKSLIFEQYMEPYLQALESHKDIDRIVQEVPEINEYLGVCRWPFRKLEYSFALQFLIAHLKPGDHYLDAGCGATPLPHAIAGQNIHTSACDYSDALIRGLKKVNIQAIFGTSVDYAVADLTNLDYPSNSFDMISCISVLEHIPAPKDQRAIQELLRVLKPGGRLVLTVDFRPTNKGSKYDRYTYFANRAVELFRKGGLLELYQGIRRKQAAISTITHSSTRHPRSAHETFRVEHLEDDIASVLQGTQLLSNIPFSTDLRSLTTTHSELFWRLDVPNHEPQGRAVLPVAFALQKPLEANN